MLFMSATSYQLPPLEILQLADYTPAPSISLDMRYEYIIYSYRQVYKNLDDLMQPEMRLAGKRVNPDACISSSVDYITNLKVGKADGSDPLQVFGLPEQPRIAFLTYSPDEKYIAFTNTTSNGLELWFMDIHKAEAFKLSDFKLNAFFGNPIVWFPDNKHLLVKKRPENQPELIQPEKEKAVGPSVLESTGEQSQNRTFTDLLKNEIDIWNFENLATSEIYKIDTTGISSLFQTKDRYKFLSVSPDGNFVLLNVVNPPYSYIVPEDRFANTTFVCKSNGEFVKNIEIAPLAEYIPKGLMAVQKNKRDIRWRNDVPSEIFYAIPLDNGDPSNVAEYRDALYLLCSPDFDQPRLIFKTPLRYAGILWCDAQLAVVNDFWYDTRRSCTYFVNPAHPEIPAKKVFDRNYQDIYSFPGNFELVKNNYGRYVVANDEDYLFLVSEGFTEKGKFPFIDKLNVKDLSIERIYQSNYSDKFEEILLFERFIQGEALVRIQSVNDFPNFFIRNITQNTIKQITFSKNPFESLKSVSKQVLKYKRKDGVELTGTLYLPTNADKIAEKLPLLIWAYPVEFIDKNSAGQTTANSNEFIYPYYGSLIYWVKRGYAVLDDASFPIIGEGENQPNDTFIEQLTQNACAAIEAAGETGCIDTLNVGIAGHSYGAFMVANLLTHTNLFKCGVARSGAYNRTLTPFGFQGEQRNFWDAKNAYDAISPFRFAEKMKTPLLLIHGENDNNSGTFTIQTERYFQALNGLGAPVRMVILPKEKHRYEAKENIMHMLWEQDRFFEKHLKQQ